MRGRAKAESEPGMPERQYRKYISGILFLVSIIESAFTAHLEMEADQVTVRLTGELDLATRPSLLTALDEAVATGTSTVVVDMRDLSFIDSTGIGALLRATHDGAQNGHVVQFRRSDGPVERTLRTAGVGSLLPLAA